MVQELELMKGGGGSIKIGATGTVATLMTRELDSMKATPLPPTPRSSRTLPISLDYAATSSSTPRKHRARKSSDEASSSSSSSSNGNNNNVRTGKGQGKSSHQVPMLGSDNISVQGTPRREKRMNIVEIVDVKCGNPDRAWVSPITTRLKKLGFSKLNETII